MRLKKLEMYGFKSFATRTEIVFNEGITGIVGPNGSGKSNIGDAVRWVLGEQSARTLRGASMQDVIFNGTQSRKPLGYCEVSLIFENEDRALNLDYAEVMVTRRVYRNGDSEYYLNRSSCRLKDIVDLFRDTGIGKEGYSIIGQGRIDEILSRKGEDRRQVFEEAAGIVKFKARKEEADKKLEHTRENLSRVDDILHELKRQLSPLEEQAKAARVYLDLSAELKVLDLNLFLHRSDRMNQKLAELDQELQALRTVLDNTEVTLQEKAEVRDARQTEITELDEKITAAHESLMTILEAVHEAQNAHAAVQSRREARRENRERMNEEDARDAQRMAELEQLSQETADGTEQHFASVAAAEAKLNAAREEEEKERLSEQQQEEALEIHKDKVMTAMNRLNAMRNDQTRLKTMRQTMETRLGEIGNDLEKLKSEGQDLGSGLEEARKRLENENIELARRTDELAKIRADLEQADADVIEARKQYDTRLVSMKEMASRRELLAEMSEEMEGYSQTVRKAVRYAEESGMTGVHGVLGRLLRVPEKYETAIDTVLGNAQQDIVTNDEETAKTLIEYLRENRLGRATFMPITAVKSKLLDAGEKKLLSMTGCLGVASDLIDCDEEYRGIVENLLGRTVVTDDLDHGIAIMRAGHHAFRLVTLKGDIIHSGGSMTGGSTGTKATNLFTRERELKELTEKLDQGQTELERLLHIMQDGQKNKDELKLRSADALEALHQQEIAVARETEHCENAQADSGDQAERLKAAEDAMDQLREAMEQIDAQLEAVTTDGEQSENDREALEHKTGILQKELTETRTRREACGEKVMTLTLELNDLKHRLETAKRDRTRLEEDLKHLNRERDMRKAQLTDMEKQDEADATEEARLNALTETRILEQKQRETAAHSLEEKRRQEQESLKEILTDMENLHQSHSRDSDRYHRVELNRAKADGDLRTMQERIWNTYEVTYAGAEEFRTEGPFNMTEADRKAAQLSTEIRALGMVNVRAVEEYAETKARFDEMTVQREDLEKAEKDLTELIAQLLTQMRTTFVENFTKLQGYFSETFTRLFGGGHAELMLADPNDPLNCGIEINAQPPGKKLQLLTLLSGGERTLTAIAILFATLKLKPTPFCILDEIEAALDDANISYFADYLVEYGKSTQFVVVTHRKGTMERCDALYGVAMEEQGVSKMVSVSLQDYRE